MKEIEIKIRIVDPEKTIDLLEKQGCVFSQPIRQQDAVFIPNEVPTVPCPAGTNVLRIRKQGDKNILTLKRSDVGNHLSKLEHELEIGNSEEMKKIIFLLGFKLIADTTKMRRKCKIKDYEICVDQVEGLGSFLEIERMSAEDPERIQEEMLAFLSSIGIDATDRVYVGYDILWVQKHQNKT